MDKGELVDLISELSGDEHDWVDLKEDYHPGGYTEKKAEFIKDISSLANVISDQSQHYIIIGVNDFGDIVGIDEEQKEYPGGGPRHIASFDESDLQETISSNLSPAPNFSIETFDIDGCEVILLSVTPLAGAPCLVTKDLNDDSNNTFLNRGTVFVRKGSGKKIADADDLQRIIDDRLQKRRSEILDGVRKAIDLGPEFVSRLSEFVPQDADITVSTSPESELEVAQRLTRDPATNLDELLNEDIGQWLHRGDLINKKALYEYYSQSDELTLDSEAITFLTKSSIKSRFTGYYWMKNYSVEEIRQVLLDTPNKYHQLKTVAKLLMLVGDGEGIKELVKETPHDEETSGFKKPIQKSSNLLRNRARYLLKGNQYILTFDGWRREFDVASVDKEMILKLIPEVADKLETIQDDYDTGSKMRYGKKKQFENALFDLEVALCWRSFDD
ncbi:AlbA family DNA-binding domain-containing protein [Haloferax volcanii]|uniref:AlbA family DNA-binding domain-containing protein n=1 Tax=Haloferax volcanii TaxID=2246 RepID=UPI00385DCBBC